jgi:hypothetical protein
MLVKSQWKDWEIRWEISPQYQANRWRPGERGSFVPKDNILDSTCSEKGGHTTNKIIQENSLELKNMSFYIERIHQIPFINTKEYHNTKNKEKVLKSHRENKPNTNIRMKILLTS